MRKHECVLGAGLLLSLAVLTIPTRSQQDKSKRPSPPASTQCKLMEGATITVDYSSPRMNGRKIYGGLNPWGQVWRAGANEATTFVSTTDVIVGGKLVPAGSYTIFVIPNPDKWTLIVNKKTGEWGIPYKWEADELLRTDMKVSQLPAPVEHFTIAFDQMALAATPAEAPKQQGAQTNEKMRLLSGCTLRMDWETTRASVEISPKN